MAGLFGGLVEKNQHGSIALSTADENGVPTDWTTIPILGEDIIDPELVRYFSAPSADTMFVTLGTWVDSEAPSALMHRFSSKLGVGPNGIEESSDNTTAAWAQVIKTTDGGNTWTVVYEDTSSGRYPNDIHCFDETRCATVLEAIGTTPLILTTVRDDILGPVDVCSLTASHYHPPPD